MRGGTILGRALSGASLILLLIFGGIHAAAQKSPPRPPQTVRLYVLDGGTLESDPARYRLTLKEVSATQLAVTAFLIVHPKGTLMWDTGAIADDSWTPNGRPVARRLVLSNSQERR